MKKIALATALLVSTNAAMALTPAEFLQKVQTTFVPSFVASEGKALQIKEKGSGFVVSVPEYQTAMGTVVAPYDITFEKTDALLGYTQYTTTLGSFSFLYPLLGDVGLTNGADKVTFLPDLNVVTKREAKADKVTSLIGADFEGFKSEDKMTDAGKKKVDVKSKASFKNFLFNLVPFASVSAKEVSYENSLKSTILTSDYFDLNMEAKSGEGEFEIKEISASSILLPVEKVTFDLKAKSTSEQENGKFDSWVHMEIKNIDVVMPDKEQQKRMPSKVKMEATILNFDKARAQKLNELNKKASADPENEQIQAEVAEALGSVMTGSTMDVKTLYVGSSEYGITLRGVANFLETVTTFDGKLEVRNFDFISPKSAPTDKALCDKEMKTLEKITKDISESEFSVEALKTFDAQREKTKLACDEKQEVLSVLRPFVDTAKKEKDDKGRDILIFDLKNTAEGSFINGQKLDTSFLSSGEM